MAHVFVGLSGGVDSSVSAALLKKAGHVVTGAFIKIWQPEFLECTWEQDRLDAKRVAAALQIPFREVDFSSEYKDAVINSMIAEYQAGRTPNPDVLCNRHIKFGFFRAWAHKEGADYVATGHYAQTHSENGAYALIRGKDRTKDQSYFLWTLTQDDLAHVLFPVGDKTKNEVRALARECRLPTAARPDSQGLCFVGDVSIGDFLARYVPQKPGSVLSESGHVIGVHAGAIRYTVGQRHGFTITHKEHAQTPQYVVRIEPKANTITVAAEPLRASHKVFTLSQCNWIHHVPEGTYTAEVRYHQVPQTCEVHVRGAHARVTFSNSQIVAEGQSIVVYHQDACLGGGVVSACE